MFIDTVKKELGCVPQIGNGNYRPHFLEYNDGLLVNCESLGVIQRISIRVMDEKFQLTEIKGRNGEELTKKELLEIEEGITLYRFCNGEGYYIEFEDHLGSRRVQMDTENLPWGGVKDGSYGFSCISAKRLEILRRLLPQENKTGTRVLEREELFSLELEKGIFCASSEEALVFYNGRGEQVAALIHDPSAGWITGFWGGIYATPEEYILRVLPKYCP